VECQSLSCERPCAVLWEQRVWLCEGCATKAERARTEFERAQERAMAEAMRFLEQFILRGGLLANDSGLELPGFGAPPRGR
jgi:hypothetical protein